jgi:hypothetical protein
LFRWSALIVFLATTVAGGAADEQVSADVKRILSTQFGGGFKILADYQVPVRRHSQPEPEMAWQPLVIGDFDGDGVEDLAVVARHRNPLLDARTNGYKVVDPYHSYFGYGDPKVTAEFISMDVGEAKHLLVIHGVGAEGWRAAAPKAKFVIINLPFDRVSPRAMRLKKKAITAIAAEEVGGLGSLLFWDKKRYRWEPTGLR